MKINHIYQGDSLNVLKTLPDESINCVVTSPPYWALRDYGIGGQLGLESTFQEYITKLCDIFDEVKRVLRKDGTCWVVIGDTYNPGGNYRGKELGDGSKEVYRRKDFEGCKNNPDNQGIERKCLTQIPSRFSIEMCNRGWILRNVIIWHKLNAMPSSAKDRFTVDFEYVFFFVKNKKYWFEQQFEDVKPESLERVKYDWNGHREPGSSYAGMDIKNMVNPKGRNKRTTWSIPTKSYPEAHFAVYPPDLIITPIKAGCPKGGIVLDPFMGAGTTGLVAKWNERNYIGIELNPKYIIQANQRIANEEKKIKERKEKSLKKYLK